jgi:hypothetical protein
VQTSSKQEELDALRSRVEQLEDELMAEELTPGRQVSRDYPMYYATGGFLLGLFGAMASLLFNVIGSLAAGKNPLELIRIYLTFPLGEKALRLVEGGGPGTYAVGDGVIIALGCCLYLATGMLLGIPLSLILARFAPEGPTLKRLIVGSVAALAIWLVSFYAILSWLQPVLFGGHWIVDNALLPWWVAAATHLVFGLTIAWLYPLIRGAPAGQSDPTS